MILETVVDEALDLAKEYWENRDRNDILNWILSSPLLAETTSSTISTNTTIGHNSFVEDSSYKGAGIEFFSSTQVGITQVGMGETGFTNSGIFKDNSTEIDSAKITLAENSIAEINFLHIAIPTKTTFVHTRSDKLDKTEVGFVESASSEISFTEVGSVIDTSNDDIINPVATSEAKLGEIFFSSSVPSEQFFSIHDSTAQTINNLNHTATNIWSNLL